MPVVRTWGGYTAPEEPPHHLGHVGQNHAGDGGLRLDRLDAVEQPAECDDRGDAGGAQQRLQLLRRVGGVGVDDDGAGFEHAEVGHHLLRQVGQHDGDAVALCHAQAGRTPRSDRSTHRAWRS